MTDERLAIDGGPKAVEKLGPFPARITGDDLKEIIRLWGLGPESVARIGKIIDADSSCRDPHLFRYYGPQPGAVDAAEKIMAEKVGSKHCLGVNSCTSALMASWRALGIGAGDEVIVPAYTFFATPSTVAAANAIPRIVEIDDSLSIDPEAVESAITPRTKAIAVVHMRGAPANMDAIMDVSERKGLPVVEDVAQAIGGTFDKKPLGSIGRMGCFSLDYFKMAAAGEGGFIATNDEWLYTRAQSWHDTAACWRPRPMRYAHEQREGELFCGENYRMSELSGAVALSQIRRLDNVIAGHRRVKRLIRDAIESFPALSFRRFNDTDGETAMWLVMFLPDAALTRRAIEALKVEGVPAGGLYDDAVRDWHVYAHWDHILEMKSVASDGLPWSGVPKEELPKYSKDMCPRTLDLLGRSIHVNISHHYSESECAAIAHGINKVMRVVLREG